MGGLGLSGWVCLAKVEELRELTVIYKLPVDKNSALNAAIDNLEAKFKVYTKSIEKQDTERALYTLDLTSGEKVSWPKFAGNIEENFSPNT